MESKTREVPCPRCWWPGRPIFRVC